MENTVLIQILKTFSEEEFKDFGRLVNSPFYNRNKKLVELYDILEVNYPEFRSAKLAPEIIYKKLYGGGKYVKATVGYLLSEMKDLTEIYLGTVHYRNNNSLKPKVGYLEELDKRKLDGVFRKELRKIENLVNEKDENAENYFLSKFELESARDIFEAKRMGGLHNKYTINYDYKSRLRALTEFFVYTVLSENEFFIALHNNYDEPYDPAGFYEISAFIERSKWVLDNPLINIRYHTVLLHLEKKDEIYFRIKKIFHENIGRMNRGESFNTLIQLKNYCALKNNAGVDSFQRERFNLFDLQIKQDILTYGSGEYLSIQTFKAAIDTACELGEIEWAESFIESQKEHIAPTDRDNCVNYAYALVSFVKNNFDESLGFLSKIPNVSNTYYKIAVKRLSLKISWEQKQYDACFDMIELYRKFLAYDKTLPESGKDSNSNFIKYFKLLLKAEGDRKGETLRKLLSEIDKDRNVIDRKWFLKKAEEIKSNR